MTVREAIKLFSYGQEFYIKGAYSGKIYHSCYSGLAEARAKKKAGHVGRHPWTQDNDLVFGRRTDG